MNAIQIPLKIQNHLANAGEFAESLCPQRPVSRLFQRPTTSSSEESEMRQRAYQAPQVYRHYSPFMDGLNYGLGRGVAHWLFPSFYSAHLPPSPTSSTPSIQPSKGKSNKVILAIAALALTAFVAYCTGREVATLSKVNEELANLKKERDYTESFLRRSNLPACTQHQLKEIFDLEESILDNYKYSSLQNLIIKGVTLAGLGLTTFAYVNDYSKLLTLGSVSTVAGSLAWAFKAGFDQTEVYVQKKANQLYHAIFDLQDELNTPQ